MRWQLSQLGLRSFTNRGRHVDDLLQCRFHASPRRVPEGDALSTRRGLRRRTATGGAMRWVIAVTLLLLAAVALNAALALFIR